MHTIRKILAHHVSSEDSHVFIVSNVFSVKAKEEFDIAKDNEDEEVYYFCKLVTEVENASNSLGREGRFQVFVCVTIR